MPRVNGVFFFDQGCRRNVALARNLGGQILLRNYVMRGKCGIVKGRHRGKTAHMCVCVVVVVVVVANLEPGQASLVLVR